ncbi:S1 family peptidase [Amycolatopsis sp. H20-H5]|uniref:S1 family peptidase n=1 Tax=Amycolatopsis sp. H20-H5 TaxID=3046309 RepID=UPI002DBA0F4F|nr:trypsin-like serine protease [Amycolatopsis sp. H20-H5]MEC3974532.1 trypsin-like serine protease [Amycolatopsis sp. H20-H5]
MRVRALITAGVLALTAALAPAPPANAVANGSDVPAGQFGFVAKLTMTNIPRPDGSTYTSYCTGSLIAPKWIVTTGHCFHDANRNRVSGQTPYPTTVLLGLTDEKTQNGQTRRGTQVLQSPQSDVALLRLDQPVTDLPPLTVNHVTPSMGQHLTLAGWGSQTATDPKPSSRLQQGTVQVTQTTPTTLGVRGVSPAATTSACTYDSGAPYFIPAAPSGQLVSIETTGPNCPHASTETTSRADTIANWLTTNTTP